MVHERREGDVHLDFSKAFSSFSFNSFIDKLMNYRVGIWTARQAENWQNCWIQGVVIQSPAGVSGGVP